MHFYSAIDLADDSILAFLKHCPQLHTISISGNNKSVGMITGKAAFVAMGISKKLGKELKKLELVDQMLDKKALAKMLHTRPQRLGDHRGILKREVV